MLDIVSLPSTTRKKKTEDDEWEIVRENLLIYKDKKLGTGAFAVVYKADLLCKNPLTERNIRRNRIASIDSLNSTEVAVKMLRNTLNENDR